MKIFYLFLPAVLLAASCSSEVPAPDTVSHEESPLTREGLSRVFSQLPIGLEQVAEVHNAVLSSACNGYDEEYMLSDLIETPGKGVGDGPTKASLDYSNPLRNLLALYLSEHCATKSGGIESLMAALADSGMQVYWPYSEDWDGKTLPVISYDPGYGAESNIGFQLASSPEGFALTDTVRVDEALARTRPVWIINNNRDAGYTPMDFFIREGGQEGTRTSVQRHLLLKSFTMLRHYDSIFQGASEFFLKIGSADGFTASTEAELKLYTTSVTDMMIVVRRKYLGVERQYDAILMTDFTNQIDKVAFLVTEDDGGTQTSWECEATVKWNSKSYGFALKIPYNEKDDIVWRGRLSSTFFQEADEVSGRFGDVVIKFALE